jgi:hypothetical protein
MPMALMIPTRIGASAMPKASASGRERASGKHAETAEADDQDAQATARLTRRPTVNPLQH